KFRGLETRRELAGLARSDDPGRQAVLALQLDDLLDAPQGGLVVREEEISALAQPDIDAQLLREAAHEIDRPFRQLDEGRRGPLRAHPAAVAARGALAEIAALEHHDAPRAAAGEVPRQR